jgi:copper chaperone CopZ
MHGTEYGRIIDGRIRIKVPEVKGSHAMAGEMESQLTELNGVAHVQANPLSGYVLVLFDSQVISHYHVFAVINDFTCLNGWAIVSPHSHHAAST